MQGMFYLLAICLILATLLPIIRKDDWWLRVFEFPRLQLAILCCLLVLSAWLIIEQKNILFVSVCLLLIASAIYQFVKIIPYTSFYPQQMLAADAGIRGQSLKLMISNVLMSNKNIDGLANLVNQHQPDILLVVESDKKWYQGLNSKLNFKFDVAEPLENTYGMLLYSNFELKNSRVEYLFENDVPSIHTEVHLSDENKLVLHCLHPKPPAPQESEDTTERDAELLTVGKRVQKQNLPTLVAGDLNDVAWSYTTRLFQKISGLLDPRIGRGMFNTFHAKIFFLRFPLDHAFASEHFTLINLKRLPGFGSDHFPMLIELILNDRNKNMQDVPEADIGDRIEAKEKIEKAQNGNSKEIIKFNYK